ncbi:site-specific integrase [Candidatus Woesearchaeota archaeon]|nr:site-specific integrase [Candidatus Woesearchaeota archaeon]
MALFCGLRESEVCNLKIHDIDLDAGKLKVRDGKNTNRTRDGYGKDRTVPIPQNIIPIIKDWIDFIGGGTYFMPAINSPDKPLRPHTLSDFFNRHLHKVNLAEVREATEIKKGKMKGFMRKNLKYTFHTLRHCYGTLLYTQTGDIYLARVLMGHADISTTMVYMHTSHKRKSERVNQAFKPVQISNSQLRDLKREDVMLMAEQNRAKELALREKEIELKRAELMQSMQPQIITRTT